MPARECRIAETLLGHARLYGFGQNRVAPIRPQCLETGVPSMIRSEIARIDVKVRDVALGPAAEPQVPVVAAVVTEREGNVEIPTSLVAPDRQRCQACSRLGALVAVQTEGPSSALIAHGVPQPHADIAR